MRFGQICKKLAMFWNTFTHSPSIHRDRKFSRKFSYLKMFSEHAGYVYDYFSAKFLSKFRKRFAQSPKINWRTFRIKTFQQSVRLNMEKAVLTILRKSLCRMSEKIAQNLNMEQKQKIEKNPHLQKVFWTRRKESGQFSVEFLPKVRKGNAHGPEKRGSGFQKKFFIKVFHWSRRKQIWHFYNYKTVISQKNVSTKVQNREEVF